MTLKLILPERAPDIAQLYAIIGHSFEQDLWQKTDLLSDAAQICQRAIRHNPSESPLWLTLLGFVAVNLELPGKALVWLQQSQKLFADSYETYLCMMLARMLLSEHSEVFMLQKELSSLERASAVAHWQFAEPVNNFFTGISIKPDQGNNAANMFALLLLGAPNSVMIDAPFPFYRADETTKLIGRIGKYHDTVDQRLQRAVFRGQPQHALAIASDYLSLYPTDAKVLRVALDYALRTLSIDHGLEILLRVQSAITSAQLKRRGLNPNQRETIIHAVMTDLLLITLIQEYQALCPFRPELKSAPHWEQLSRHLIQQATATATPTTTATASSGVCSYLAPGLLNTNVSGSQIPTILSDTPSSRPVRMRQPARTVFLFDRFHASERNQLLIEILAARSTIHRGQTIVAVDDTALELDARIFQLLALLLTANIDNTTLVRILKNERISRLLIVRSQMAIFPRYGLYSLLTKELSGLEVGLVGVRANTAADGSGAPDTPTFPALAFPALALPALVTSAPTVAPYGAEPQVGLLIDRYPRQNCHTQALIAHLQTLFGKQLLAASSHNHSETLSAIFPQGAITQISREALFGQADLVIDLSALPNLAIAYLAAAQSKPIFFVQNPDLSSHEQSADQSFYAATLPADPALWTLAHFNLTCTPSFSSLSQWKAQAALALVPHD